MKNHIKKVSIFLLSMMLLGMTSTAFAEEVQPFAEDQSQQAVTMSADDQQEMINQLREQSIAEGFREVEIEWLPNENMTKAWVEIPNYITLMVNELDTDYDGIKDVAVFRVTNIGIDPLDKMVTTGKLYRYTDSSLNEGIVVAQLTSNMGTEYGIFPLRSIDYRIVVESPYGYQYGTGKVVVTEAGHEYIGVINF